MRLRKQIRSGLHSVQATAPASSANCISGFDCLGFSFSPFQDAVTLTIKSGGTSLKVEGLIKDIPTQLEENIVGIILKRFMEEFSIEADFNIVLDKGIPVASGLGGSSASIIAFLKALNACLEKPLNDEDLLEFAIWAESCISGDRHADNIVPAFFGGCFLINSEKPYRSYSLPIPRDFLAVICLADLQIQTKEARAVLPKSIDLKLCIRQCQQIASFIHFMHGAKDDFKFNDEIAEGFRKEYIPGFDSLKQLVLKNGALGFSFSGSGPALIAFCNQRNHAERIQRICKNHFQQLRIESQSYIYHPNSVGAQISMINGVKIS